MNSRALSATTIAVAICCISTMHPRVDASTYGLSQSNSKDAGVATARSNATYIVTSLDDNSNPGTLRYAMEQAEASGLGGEIYFDVSGTIQLTDSLPVVTTIITLHGESSPDGIMLNKGTHFSGSILATNRLSPQSPQLHVEDILIADAEYGVNCIDGFVTLINCSIVDCDYGVRALHGSVWAEGCIVAGCIFGVTLGELPSTVRSCQATDNSIGIYLTGCCHSIEQNYVGIEANGATFATNSIGIYLGVPGDVTDVDVLDNFICASDKGIVLDGVDGAYDNEFRGNIIGLNASGTQSCNGSYGIYSELVSAEYFPHDNIFEDNTISGHTQWGIFFQYTGLPGVSFSLGGANELYYNKIGTDPSGTVALPNLSGGVRIASDQVGVYGLPVIMSNNVVSGNGGPGIVIESMRGAVLGDNHVGVSATGKSLPNDGDGIQMLDIAAAEIGKSGTWDRPNLVSWNKGYGIKVERCSSSVLSKNVVTFNEQGGIRMDCPTGPGNCDGNDLTDNAVYGNGSLNLIPEDGLDLDIAEDWGVNGGIAPPRIWLNYSVAEGWCVTGRGPAGSTVKVYLARDWETGSYTDGVHPLDSGGSIYSYSIGEALCGSSPDDSGMDAFGDMCGLTINASPTDFEQFDVVTALAVGADGPSQFSRNAAAQSAVWLGLSPIGMTIVDPQGDSCGPGFSSIPGSVYDSLTDVNSDGDPDDQIILSAHYFGDYEVRVFRRPEAQPGDTYTLKAMIGNDTVTLASNQPVPEFGDTTVLVQTVEYRPACCIGMAGDVNSDAANADPVDLAFLVDYLFSGGAAPVCDEEADVNGDGVPADPVDLSYLVDYLFSAGTEPMACP